MTVRTYQPADRFEVEACMVALQEYEKSLGADRKPGVEIAKTYVDHLLNEVSAKRGAIYVAQHKDQIVGFVSVWIDQDDELIAKGETQFVYCSDVIVLEGFRQQGIGRKLLAAVEAYAKERGVATIMCAVIVNNTIMRQGLSRAGLREYEVVYRKKVGEE